MTVHLAIVLQGILVAIVIIAATPLAVADYQFLLVAVHFRRLHYDRCRPWFPRTAILIPAWNEAAVIGASIDRLMRLDYPREALRIYVVDDASTDDTPEVVQGKADQYPGNVVHLRRDKGGEGKAHTLNHGLAVILADDWMQAVLIMDADVIYEAAALRRMTCHLADPEIGAVTAYIREGSRPANFMARFIGYEYITAQAAARRSQNVIGAIACLAGGAQLHSRANIEAIGGRIDSTTLAEDTITTFRTQLMGRRVVFEPHAVVWAEEPATITGLWKQRVRWARGNFQVTRRYKHIWFRPWRHRQLGSLTFGTLWFSIFLLPVFLLSASAALITLYFVDYRLAMTAFGALLLVNVVTYVFITSFALLIDPVSAKRSWRSGLKFPGVINVLILLAAAATGPLRWLLFHLMAAVGLTPTPAYGHALVLFTFVWLSASMAVAYLAKVTETRLLGRFISPVLCYLAGYGPLLCAITLAAYGKELRGADSRWDKTEKTGKVAISA
jgi:cellulose synthase/poly-beta-1,6-N-acetylglucosamine synthase-like glycosyltransferase